MSTQGHPALLDESPNRLSEFNPHNASSASKPIPTAGRRASETTHTMDESTKESFKPTSLPLPATRRGSSPQKSPLRRLFSRNTLPISPSPSSTFGTAHNNRTYDIHLFDYGTHSEIRFEPFMQSPRTPSYLPTMDWPITGYGIVCTKMTEKEVVLCCKDDRGVVVATLKTSIRGTDIEVSDWDETAWLEEGDKGSGCQKIHVDGAMYHWAEATGLAILVDLETRHKLAKLHFNVLARDRLTVSEEGLDVLPLIVVSAAKVSIIFMYVLYPKRERSLTQGNCSAVVRAQ
ncbi:hypothetical protein I302_103403 [Kwoniella bestiolae CBS 10118]|uniref:Uncharacterized protein n=1 Tax=Kwoniella bestiolae CBS 10118 TaxID=1296100 RepID=A0A1B9G8D2_9TREE|nr:hypothetical protein I302_02103 [Kwoniella bestiolae CBS 10118]OCF27263.1 hypothetical protein I302_02103 [Kwoniella bestiolae CBS 10118]